MDRRQKFLVLGYFLYLGVGYLVSFWSWVGLTHSGCAAAMQYFSGASLKERVILVGFMPAQFLLNLVSDVYSLGLFAVFWKWRDVKRPISAYSSTTAFCLANSMRVITGTHPAGSGFKGEQTKAKIKQLLEKFPDDEEHKWHSVEEGMAVVRKFSKRQKVMASIRREYANVESRVGSLLSYGEDAILEVYSESGYLVQLANDAYTRYLENYPIIQPSNGQGYAPTPLFEDALAEQGLTFEELREEVSSILKDHVEILRSIFQTKKDYKPMEFALAFLTRNTMLEGSILSTSASGALKRGLRSQFHNEASNLILEQVVMPMSNAGSIQDALFYSASTVLNDLQIIRQLPILHTPINYAQLERGASVVSAGTSPSANKGNVNVELLSIHSSTAHRDFNIPMLFDPRNAITPGTDLEEPWLMESSSGTLNIRLAEPIIPSFITLHSPIASHEPHPTTSPKDIEIWASTTTSQILLAKHKHHPDAVDIINIHNTMKSPLPTISKISLKVLNNYGNPNYTKIYQIGVYGFPEEMKQYFN